MNELNRVVAEAVARQVAPVFRLAAAVRAHVVYHGLHPREAFVTDSEIRALSPVPRAALIEQRDRYQNLFNDMIVAGTNDGSLSASSSRVATYAILLQCTGVAMWFNPQGALSIDEVADLHVELALGSLHATRDLIDQAIRAVRPTPSGAGHILSEDNHQ